MTIIKHRHSDPSHIQILLTARKLVLGNMNKLNWYIWTSSIQRRTLEYCVVTEWFVILSVLLETV